MKKKLFFLILISLHCAITKAQTVIRLFDISNKMPVPYCSVVVGKSIFFSDLEGNVSVENTSLAKSDSIHFNRIGYQAFSIDTQYLLTTQEIALTPVIYKLSEIQVKPLDLSKFMALLSNKYTDNVSSSAYQAKAYFVSTVKFNGIYKKYADSYMHLFSFGNIDKFFKGNNKDTPVTVGVHLNTRLSNDYLKPLLGKDSLLDSQLLLNEPFLMQKYFLYKGPLNLQNRANFVFNYEGYKDGQYLISFESKFPQSKNTFIGKGNLWIAEEDSMLVKAQLFNVKLPIPYLFLASMGAYLKDRNISLGYTNEYTIIFNTSEKGLLPISTSYHSRLNNGLEEYSGVFLKSLPDESILEPNSYSLKDVARLATFTSIQMNNPKIEYNAKIWSKLNLPIYSDWQKIKQDIGQGEDLEHQFLKHDGKNAYFNDSLSTSSVSKNWLEFFKLIKKKVYQND